MLPTNTPVISTVDGRRVWLFSDGHTLPVVSGGADDDPDPDDPPDPDPDPADPPEPDPDDDPDEPLGPKGEKALAAMKAELKTARAEAKRAKELQAQLDELAKAQMSEHEKAVADALEAGRAEGAATVRSKLIAAEVRAAAVAAGLNTKILSSPGVDVMTFLGFDAEPITETGDVNSEAISERLQEFAKANPDLAVSATRPAPITQGARPSTQAKDPAEMSTAEYIEHQRKSRSSS